MHMPECHSVVITGVRIVVLKIRNMDCSKLDDSARTCTRFSFGGMGHDHLSLYDCRVLSKPAAGAYSSAVTNTLVNNLLHSASSVGSMIEEALSPRLQQSQVVRHPL